MGLIVVLVIIIVLMLEVFFVNPLIGPAFDDPRTPVSKNQFRLAMFLSVLLLVSVPSSIVAASVQTSMQ